MWNKLLLVRILFSSWQLIIQIFQVCQMFHTAETYSCLLSLRIYHHWKKKTGQKTTHPCSKKVGRTFCTIKFPIQSLHCLWVRWQWCKVEISLSALKVAHIQILLVPIDFPISVLSLSSSHSKCPLSPLGIWFTRECCITQRRKPTTVSTFLVLRRWG